MSIDQRLYTLQIDMKIIPRHGLSKDEADYWASRTLQVLPKSRVVIIRADTGQEREVSR